MKKNDIAILILIVAVSLAAAYFVGRSLLANTNKGQASVERVEAINPDIASKPDPVVFNKDAINPSVSIIIGNNTTTQQPFGR